MDRHYTDPGSGQQTWPNQKPRARTCPTLHMSVIKLVPSPSEQSPFLDMTILTMQK